jgi:lipoprotein-releasing system permease protein
VDLQQGIIPLIIMIIMVVAAFNIVSTLLMLILEKTGEIGIIRSMGATSKMIRRLYLSLGFLIGSVGTGLGVLLALLFAFLQIRFGIIPLPKETYYMDSAPIALDLVDFFWVGILAVVLCVLAAYIPARVAARMDPIRSIRFSG